MTYPTAEQIAKLPQWAQRHIQSLEDRAKMDKEYYDERLRQVDEKDTNTFIDGGGLEDYLGLPKGQRICFTFSDVKGWRRDPHITARVIEGRGPIYLELSGDDSLVVEPYSSNVIRVRMRDR